MRRYLSYFWYVIRHKWFVFLACCRMGMPLRGVVHDWTKLLPREFFPYAKNFFNRDGSRRDVRDKTGAYDPNAQPDSFKQAWMHHQRNRHHWQAWVSIGDGGNLTALPMPRRFVKEMVADWAGAGRAISGCKNPRPWWEANGHKMVLHDDTESLVELILDRYGYRKERPICPGCKNEIDPEVCHCGDAIKDHNIGSGHSAVPMGCDCGKTKD